MRHLVAKLPKRKEKETRNLKGSKSLNGVPKALERMEYPPTDSSDEELERDEEAAELLALEGDSDEDEDEDM